MGDLTRTTPEIAELMKREPAAEFPARIAVVRVQGQGYVAGGTGCIGRGAFCVVTARDLEHEQDYARLGDLAGVAAIGPVTALLVPGRLESLDDLRLAAASLKADMLLVYTVDTRFHVEGKPLGPLSLVSLGMIPNKKANVTTTASAALVDVRSGFIFGVAEATARADQRATIWSTQDAIEAARSETERESFVGLLGEFERLWQGVVNEHLMHDSAN
jgi:hypothetical protein